MKTELRTTPEGTIEIWHGAKMVGTVVGSECCAGVKVVSPLPMMPKWHPDGVAEIRIADEEVQLPLPLEL